MKTLKIILPIIIILVVIAFGYSFIHIDGQEIKFVDELLEAKTVTVIVMGEKNDDPKVEYDLNIEQIKNLKKEMLIHRLLWQQQDLIVICKIL